MLGLMCRIRLGIAPANLVYTESSDSVSLANKVMNITAMRWVVQWCTAQSILHNSLTEHWPLDRNDLHAILTQYFMSIANFTYLC